MFSVYIVNSLVFYHHSESKNGSVWNCVRAADGDGIRDMSSGMNNVLKQRLQHPIRSNLDLVCDLHYRFIVTDWTVYSAKYHRIAIKRPRRARNAGRFR